MTHNSKSRVLWTHGCVLKQGFQPCKAHHQDRPEHDAIACCLLGTPLGHFTLSLAKPGASLPGSSWLTTVFGHPFERDVTLKYCRFLVNDVLEDVVQDIFMGIPVDVYADIYA